MGSRVRAGLRPKPRATKMQAPSYRDAPSREVEPRMGTGKWMGRDGAARRQCVVPGCRNPAVATLRIDPAARRAWLVALAPAPTDEDLCTRHADALQGTREWALHDLRDAHRGEASIARARHTRPHAGPPNTAWRLDLRRPEQPVEGLLEARSPLLSRAFAKARDA
jgi:hypothetical protein